MSILQVSGVQLPAVLHQPSAQRKRLSALLLKRVLLVRLHSKEMPTSAACMQTALQRNALLRLLLTLCPSYHLCLT